jgi:hypothetical protein
MKIERMWINQPSTLQLHHKLHGTHVLACLINGEVEQVYFLDGEIVSQKIAGHALSRGWPSDEATRKSPDFTLARPYFKPPFRHDCGMIWDSGPGAGRIMDIRGWGHLTGTGACNLPADKAAAIQEQIGESVAALLNLHWNSPCPAPHSPASNA